MPSETPENAHAGRVLVIEDESLVSMLIEDALLELGYELAGQASRLQEALDKVRSLTFDIAILDVNLDGEPSFPVAEVLVERGIPFVFATGYGAAVVPSPLQTVPILQKPFQQEELARVLRAAWSSNQTKRADLQTSE